MASAPIPTQFVVPFKASLTLAQINQQVAVGESYYGPLYAIAHDNTQSLITFVDGVSPTTPTVIAPQIGGVPSIPSGQGLITAGTIFIAGTLTLAAATR